MIRFCNIKTKSNHLFYLSCLRVFDNFSSFNSIILAESGQVTNYMKDNFSKESYQYSSFKIVGIKYDRSYSVIN